jgi:uracil-DNA glycosylase
MVKTPAFIAPGPEPVPSCARCARLVEFRQENVRVEPDWFNAPVPSFGPSTGDDTAELLIVGLAPGLRGANRTGRPFTGDFAGDLLFATLTQFGFAEGTYAAHADDGLKLRAAMITNAVRCVPPQNRPTGGEILACQPFLAKRMETLPRLRAIVVLGRIAHDSTVQALGARKSAHPFKHGARHAIERPGTTPVAVFDSYHCSRYNTNTGRLTPAMFHAVFASVRQMLTAT